MREKPNLKIKLDAIELQNPVMSASGTFGYSRAAYTLSASQVRSEISW
jgi:hypothetical protein